MPSFDVVSEVNEVELRHAVDNANREVSTRFDFRGVVAKIELMIVEGPRRQLHPVSAKAIFRY